MEGCFRDRFNPVPLFGFIQAFFLEVEKNAPIPATVTIATIATIQIGGPPPFFLESDESLYAPNAQ